MLPGMGGFIGTAVVAGSQTYSTPGTYTFDVPAYNTITFEVWGGGGGGMYYPEGGSTQYAGSNGSDSTVSISLGTITGSGGPYGASGGSGSGPTGTVVEDGGSATYYGSRATMVGGVGGGTGGGAGGVGLNPGSQPGGGGGGYIGRSSGGYSRYGWSGAGGGKATFTTDAFVGLTATIVVGGGGAGGNGANCYGGDGKVVITWS